jgi:hypothetical protein
VCAPGSDGLSPRPARRSRRRSVETAGLRPDPPDDVDELLGAAVSLLLGRVIAFAVHLRVGSPGDDVDRDAAAADPVEAGDCLGELCRELNARPMGDDRLDAL